MKAEFSNTTTRCHKELHSILSNLGFTVADNVEFDDYKIDCFVSEINRGFEADGKLYHWKNRDAKRDKYIFDKFGVEILRISDTDLMNRSKITEIEEKILEFVTNDKKAV